MAYRAGHPASAWQGAMGTVVCAGRGPGPRNVLVETEDLRRVVAPRGNLLEDSKCECREASRNSHG